MIQPLDMASLHTQQHLLQQGFQVVESADGTGGVTIKLQPPASTNGRASLLAFLIQCEPSPVTDSQRGRMDHDSHH